MKAMILHRPQPADAKPLKPCELPDPVPGRREIRIAVRACGVCRTDLHTVEGDLPLPRLPIVPGHQIVGIVEAAGDGAELYAVGRKVGVPWLYSTCRKCEFCTRELENLCPEARFTGLHVNGGYAEKFVAHEEFAYPLPQGISDEHAAPLLCAGIIGYRALKAACVKPGERLGMYGFGGSAHLAIQVARHQGYLVYVFTRSQGHRRLARRLGAVWTGGAGDDPGVKMHGSIIFAPAGSLVPKALSALERGGTLALAGVTMSPIPELDYERHLYWERSVRSVANFTRRDAEELLSLAAEIPLETTVESHPLEEANEVLVALKESRIDGTAVLVV